MSVQRPFKRTFGFPTSSASPRWTESQLVFITRRCGDYFFSGTGAPKKGARCGAGTLTVQGEPLKSKFSPDY